MSTIKLYEIDAYQTQFDATVLTCTPKGDRWLVALDQTCFYPEGGGQPWDTGILGDANVLEVHSRDGIIQHTTDRPLAEGSRVHGQIDWDRRFDLMQNHSGEHIVSGIVHNLYGFENKGFHMGTDMITVDWDGVLDWQQLLQIEALANRVIWKNAPTHIFVPSPEELQVQEYRSKKALEWPVRLVAFPQADICACCGTHVASAGEIGMIKMVSVARMRGGIRVEMLCGQRAMEYCNRIQQENRQISTLLSAKEGETSRAVQRLYDEHQQLKLERNNLEGAYFQQLSQGYRDKGDCMLFMDSCDAGSLRRLTIAVMEVCGGTCYAFAPGSNGGYSYCVGQQDGDVRQAVKALNQALQGRGGGKGGFAQGVVQAEEATIRSFLRDLGLS